MNYKLQFGTEEVVAKFSKIVQLDDNSKKNALIVIRHELLSDISGAFANASCFTSEREDNRLTWSDGTSSDSVVSFKDSDGSYLLVGRIDQGHSFDQDPPRKLYSALFVYTSKDSREDFPGWVIDTAKMFGNSVLPDTMVKESLDFVIKASSLKL